MKEIDHKHRGRVRETVDLVSASSLGAIDLFTWIELTAPHYDFLQRMRERERE